MDRALSISPEATQRLQQVHARIFTFDQFVMRSYEEPDKDKAREWALTAQRFAQEVYDLLAPFLELVVRDHVSTAGRGHQGTLRNTMEIARMLRCSMTMRERRRFDIAVARLFALYHEGIMRDLAKGRADLSDAWVMEKVYQMTTGMDPRR